jgi:hypothetical protein
MRRAGNDPMNAAKYSVVNSAKPEDLCQPLYDRVNIATTVPAQISFFSVQLGGTATLIRGVAAPAAVTKTRRDTNLDTSGVVPTKLYQFFGLAVNYIPNSATVAAAATSFIGQDIMLIKNNGWLDFKIIDKPILQAPIHMIPETNPITAIASTANNVTIVGAGVISAVPFPMYKFGIPITLNPFESFSFLVNFDGAVTLQQSFDMQILLHSFMRRPT